MSREKLKESLLEKRDARARTIWEEAEQKARRYRQETEASSADQRQKRVARIESEVTEQLDRLSSRIGKRLRRTRLLAEETFSEQLRQKALQRLTTLTPEERRRSLQRLARELPGLDWKQITVHPEDRQQAARIFPDCAIDTDPTLTGVIAATVEKTLSVDNSLAKRLEQSWPELSGCVLDSLRTKRE
jgi:vacuolar-type H+-ATPase subunit E/Vma4